MLGVFAFQSYKRSEGHIQAVFEDLDQRGKTLSTEECVSAVLDWHANCEAMKSLCDHAIPMAMEHCLTGQDRASYCQSVGEDSGRGQWTFHKCRERGVDPRQRSTRNACTDAYRAVAWFCVSGQKAVVL